MVRANNYGVESTMPPDNPSKRVDMVDFDAIMAKVKAGEKVSLCRCYKSKSFPYCDGSHNSHNKVCKRIVPPDCGNVQLQRHCAACAGVL
jgi:CDGSH-type Zn-finger protein